MEMCGEVSNVANCDIIHGFILPWTLKMVPLLDGKKEEAGPSWRRKVIGVRWKGGFSLEGYIST